MILDQYYLSDSNNIHRACDDTGLSQDEIIDMLGYFTKQSHRAGLLRGKIVFKINRQGVEVYEIRHHFNNKLYWSSND